MSLAGAATTATLQRARWAPWLAAAAGCAFACWLLAPGWMSWDSAYQWKQARTGAFDATHPPLITLLWAWIEPFWSGPMPMLVLQQVLLWGALGGIAASLPTHWSLCAGLVLVLGLWPPLLLLSGHIWKDIPMLGAFALAVWMLRLELAQPGWRWRLLAVLMLLLACLCRHNAITGAAPLLLWIVWRSLPTLPRFAALQPAPGPLLRAALALPPALVLALAVHALAQLPNHAPGVKNPQALWSVVALWDLAAVSLDEGVLLAPAAFQMPEAQVEALRPHFNHWSNTTLYESGQLVHTLWKRFPDADVAALRRAWLRLPFEHPGPYFAHRLRVAALLFGFDNAALPDHQVLMAGQFAMEGNPPVAVPSRPARDALLAWATRNVDGPFFMGWLYLLLALGTGLVALPGFLRDSPQAALAGAVAASALCYALPLAVVSGSAEFRYLAWPLLAALLAPLLLRWGARHEGTPSAD